MLKLFRLFFVAASFLTSSFNFRSPHAADKPILFQDQDQPNLETEIYLPVIFRPMPMPVYGAETYDFQTWKLNSANAAGVKWLRQSAFDWDLIEPVRYDSPVYDWSQVDEAGLIRASSRNLTVIGTIKFTPSWAQKIPGEYCGPIALNSMDEFARFVSALVARYSIPPYNIRYWEFGNEVDIDPDLLPDPRNVYGCWGDDFGRILRRWILCHDAAMGLPGCESCQQQLAGADRRSVARLRSNAPAARKKLQAGKISRGHPEKWGRRILRHRLIPQLYRFR